MQSSGAASKGRVSAVVMDDAATGAGQWGDDDLDLDDD